MRSMQASPIVLSIALETVLLAASTVSSTANGVSDSVSSSTLETSPPADATALRTRHTTALGPRDTTALGPRDTTALGTRDTTALGLTPLTPWPCLNPNHNANPVVKCMCSISQPCDHNANPVLASLHHLTHNANPVTIPNQSNLNTNSSSLHHLRTVASLHHLTLTLGLSSYVAGNACP